MKRRQFLRAFAAVVCTGPLLAVTKDPPSKKFKPEAITQELDVECRNVTYEGRLSPDDIDDFIEVTLSRLNKSKFKEIAEDLENYLWAEKQAEKEGSPYAIDWWIGKEV